MRLLFVCTANICRSAYAEVVARHVVGPDSPLEVASAGTHGYIDHPVDAPMAEELRRRGVDPDGFRSRRLTMRMVEEADLVLTAATVHRQFVLDERPELFRRVLTLAQLDDALAEVDPDLRGPELLDAVRAALRPADPGADVLDPYRRGLQAAAEAAAHLDRMLDPALRRLAGTGLPAAG